MGSWTEQGYSEVPFIKAERAKKEAEKKARNRVAQKLMQLSVEAEYGRGYLGTRDAVAAWLREHANKYRKVGK